VGTATLKGLNGTLLPSSICHSAGWGYARIGGDEQYPRHLSVSPVMSDLPSSGIQYTAALVVVLQPLDGRPKMRALSRYSASYVLSSI